jgi:glyoxylase-like metal-dependent hydrolase (beta-lactamase superfamily II)/8-oxo-dGTP pyrophosphatase MutT (NUDIX family)
MHEPGSDHGKSEARAAAVALLWRRTGSGSLEVFWARRSPKLAFLGGFWAFPGGGVEPSDASLAATCARELHEETGVALAPSDFRPAGRTVTPPWVAIRFDASYFLVEAPPDAAPDVARAGGELVAGEWTTPAAALERWARGERLTSPVAVAVLRALAAGGRAAEMADRVRAELAGLGDGRLVELAPGLGMIALRSPTLPPATHTNCFLVGADEVIVVDPGSPYPEEQAALDAALEGRRIAEIWLTHHHVDHVAGVAHLLERQRAPVAAHPATAERVAGVDRLLRDGEVAGRLRVVATPGHTAGHHAFLDEATGWVLAGDMVAGVGTVVIDDEDGDMLEYLESIGRLEALAARALLPAHGPFLTEPAQTLAFYREHRLWRERRVVDALPGTLPELVARAYADVPIAMHPIAAQSLRAHLKKLVREGRAVAEDDRYRAAVPLR